MQSNDHPAPPFGHYPPAQYPPQPTPAQPHGSAPYHPGYTPSELGQINGSYSSGPSTPSVSSSYRAPLPQPYQYPSYSSSTQGSTSTYHSHQSYHSHHSNPYPPHQPSPAPPQTQRALPSVEAVPQPTPKVAYDAPVFQTFQERKRARDMALRAKAGGDSPVPVPGGGGSPITGAPPPPAPFAPRYAAPAAPSPMPTPGPVPVPTQMVSPSPSTLAMMGQPTRVGPPPAPPARSRSPSVQGGSVRPSPSISQGGQGRPLPPPRIRTPLPAGTGQSTPTTSGPPSPVPSLQGFAPQQPAAGAVAGAASPVEAVLDRSDTISSIKSLDRTSFSSSSGRPLPKPPGGVNPSKSLDRGTMASSAGVTVEGLKKAVGRRQPSTVREDGEELASGMGEMSLNGDSTPSRSPVSPSSPRTPTRSAPPSLPVINHPGDASPADPRAPARFTPLPAINVADSDTSSIASSDHEPDSEADTSGASQVTPRAKKTTSATPSSPGIQFSGAPVIAVTSSDTADEMPQGGEISFAVPSFSFDTADSAPTLPAIIVPPSITLPSTSSSPAAPAVRPQQTRVQPNGHAIVCAGCNHPIIGRIVNAMDQRWHPQCFMCAECGELLEHVSSFEWEGKAYCHLDYHDKFAHRCHHCKTPIVEPRFVTLDDPVLGQRYYHELHFFCSECGDPFLDPSKSSAPGTEKSRGGGAEGDEEGDEGETSAFVIHKGHPYCERCHLRLHKPRCKACSQPIPDVAINAMGAKWHKECFVCSSCAQEFANNLFFPQNGKALCTMCYEGIIAAGAV